LLSPKYISSNLESISLVFIIVVLSSVSMVLSFFFLDFFSSTESSPESFSTLQRESSVSESSASESSVS